MSDSNGHDKDPPNLDTLIKCMKMTTHENDNQALVAIRAANKQVAKFGGDWESILRGKVRIIGDPFSAIPPMPPRTPTAPARAPAPPPPPQPRYTPPPPPPPPPQPKNGDRRPNRFTTTCHLCNKQVRPYDGHEIYSSLMGTWEGCHTKCPTPPRRDNERTNKFAGKCIKCTQRVEAFEGTTYHDGTKWKTEHLSGKCPSPSQRKRNQPLTGDDLLS